MASNLRDAGHRFSYRPGSGWNWRPVIEAGDIDATDLDDTAFECLVRSVCNPSSGSNHTEEVR